MKGSFNCSQNIFLMHADIFLSEDLCPAETFSVTGAP